MKLDLEMIWEDEDVVGLGRERERERGEENRTKVGIYDHQTSMLTCTNTLSCRCNIPNLFTGYRPLPENFVLISSFLTNGLCLVHFRSHHLCFRSCPSKKCESGRSVFSDHCHLFSPLSLGPIWHKNKMKRWLPPPLSPCVNTLNRGQNVAICWGKINGLIFICWGKI
jgi:hypothetical protein